MGQRLLQLALACCIANGVASGQEVQQSAPGQEVQQLQEKLKQLEQQTQELKERLAALEKSNQVTTGGSSSPAESQSAQQATTVNETGKARTLNTIYPVPVADSAPSAPAPANANPQGPSDANEKPRLDIYGIAQLDMGYDTGRNDPNWFDVVRPTKLPSAPGEFGRDGRFYSGVRQSRFGVKGYFPTDLGELKTIFEFELFGVGVDAGQTTFRLRHAWGELGPVGAGQTWSPFMDPDVFPNSLEYWGPNGMVFFRNVQVRFQPINKGNRQLWIALERPGATADQGLLANRIELQNVQGRFPAPDLSARFRWGGERGYFQVAGIGRYIAWDDLNPGQFNLTSNTWGWGAHVSSNIPVAKKDTIKLSVVYGHGIQNYMNDAPVDIAPKPTLNNPIRPIDGDPLPVLGVVAFYDRYWNDRWSTSVGYSLVNIENTSLQLPNDFHRGHYGLANLLFYPAKNAMLGGEFQWGRRENFRDGWIYDDYRIQFGARYNFDYKLGGTK